MVPSSDLFLRTRQFGAEQRETSVRSVALMEIL